MVYQYNLTVEQQVGWNTVVTVSYAGSLGRHWIRDRSPNTRIPQFQTNGTPIYPATGPRINPAFGNIRQIDRGYERIDERLRGLGARIERADL